MRVPAQRCKTLRPMAAATAFLSGLRVLDLSIWRPGPYATSLLVALGADVLKVEPPGGDPMRRYEGLFASINAGKRSVVLDLKDDAGRARGLALAEQADVLVEGFRPGVMARLGLDEAAVRARNPALVYCSISGYGQEGERATLPGHDVNYQAWAGALTPAGGTATLPTLPTADLAAGLAAAFGICAAVIGRGASKEGTYLDVSMTDVMATWTGRTGADSGTSSRDGGAGTGAGRWDARLRALRHRRRRPGRPGRRQRAALLVGTVRRAGSGRALGPGLRGAEPPWRRVAAGRPRRGRRAGARRAGHPPRRGRRARGTGAGPGGDAGQRPLSHVPDPPASARRAPAVPALDQHRGEDFCDRA